MSVLSPEVPGRQDCAHACVCGAGLSQWPRFRRMGGWMGTLTEEAPSFPSAELDSKASVVSRAGEAQLWGRSLGDAVHSERMSVWSRVTVQCWDLFPVCVTPALRFWCVFWSPQPDYINPRAVQLGSLLVRGLTTLVLVNSACGFPWKMSDFMPWNIFDGKLFHQKYLQSEKGYAVEVLLEQNVSSQTPAFHQKHPCSSRLHKKHEVGCCIFQINAFQRKDSIIPLNQEHMIWSIRLQCQHNSYRLNSPYLKYLGPQCFRFRMFLEFRNVCIYSWSLNSARVKGSKSFCSGKPAYNFSLPQNVTTKSLLLTRSLNQ